MQSKIVEYFTNQEEEFAQILTELGVKRNIAKSLVFLMRTSCKETTSRDIELGADLRQPEVSVALGFLVDEQWISCETRKNEAKGRPINIYRLKAQFGEILAKIEENKVKEAEETFSRIRKLRSCIA